MSLPFTPDDLPSLRLRLSEWFPHVALSVSTLGGAERSTLFLHLSLDARSEWANGIFHNSRYLIASIDHEGTLAGVSYGMGCGKIRKARRAVVASDFTRAVCKLVAWAADSAPARVSGGVA